MAPKIDKIINPDGGVPTADEKKAIKAISHVASTLLAGASGSDIDVAGYTALNEVSNNYLNHIDASRLKNLKRKLQDCQFSGGNCTQFSQQITALNRKDRQSDTALLNACNKGSASSCANLRAQAMIALASYGDPQGVGGETYGKKNELERIIFGTDKTAQKLAAIVLGPVAAGIVIKAGSAVLMSCLSNPVVCTEIVAEVNAEYATGGAILSGGIAGFKVADEIAEEVGKRLAVRGSGEGKISIQNGAKPNQNELRAGEGFANQGYEIKHRATANDSGIQGQSTSDLYVNGEAVDVYTPKAGTSIDAILTKIGKKAKQGNVVVQGDFSKSQMKEISTRTFGKGKQDAVYFQNSSGKITEYRKD